MELGLDAVTSGYGGIPIVREVSLEVGTGEIVAIVGRNGVGKTTLIDTVAGLLPVMGGRITFRGRDITHADARDRARLGMGYVPQGRGIFTRLSVEENLRMGELVGAGQDRAAAFERVYGWFPRLGERRRQRAGTLSGGEQQMLAIGRILIGTPRILLLDEPSEGIQPTIVALIAEVIATLNREDALTVLLVEQNIDLVCATAHRCIVVDKGATAATLSPDELADPEIARRYLAI